MKTQKAKGIISGLNKFLSTNKRSAVLSAPSHHLIANEKDIHNTFYVLPAFARPCPKSPKHGFVESRKIDTKEQLLALWKEVKEKDPSGEIILGQSFSKVDYNSIYVSSGQLSIGAGNDGATGGKNSTNFPVAPFAFTPAFKKSIGVKDNDAIYIEAIKAKRNYDYESFWYLTQMRGGPEISGAAVDYVPKSIKVKKVIVPSHDLIEWEKACKKMEAGTVVYGDGYTLASHAGVHCIINKIPFITSSKPVVGETLKPVANEEPVLNTELFRKGATIGISLMKSLPVDKAFYFSVSVLHNWAYLRNSEHSSWLLGAASVMYAQMCTAMIFGEYRHCSTCHKYKDDSRDGVYENVFLNIHSYIPKIHKVVKCFHLDNWGDGYGGLPWATCAWYTYNLWKDIAKAYNSKFKNIKNNYVGKIINSINKTTNLAHNNGWWFNKLVQKEDMDFLAAESGIAALSVSDIYMNIYNKTKKMTSVSEKLTEVGNMKEPFSTDKDGKIFWCTAVLRDDDYDYDYTVRLRMFRESTGKKKSKSIKFTSKEYKALIKKAKNKGLSATKNIQIPVVKNYAILPNGKKVNVS